MIILKIRQVFVLSDIDMNTIVLFLIQINQKLRATFVSTIYELISFFRSFTSFAVKHGLNFIKILENTIIFHIQVLKYRPNLNDLTFFQTLAQTQLFYLFRKSHQTKNNSNLQFNTKNTFIIVRINAYVSPEDIYLYVYTHLSLTLKIYCRQVIQTQYYFIIAKPYQLQASMPHKQIDSESLHSDEPFSLHSCSQDESSDDQYYLKKNYYIKKGKKMVRKYRKNGIKVKYNSSIWTKQENEVYLKFLCEKGQLFDSDKIRRKIIKINVQMSEVIKTRSPDQCRSHHQKMMKRHRSIPVIIRRLSSSHQSAPPDPTEPEQPICQVSLKDLSQFEVRQAHEESIWHKLIDSFPTEGALSPQASVAPPKI